MRTKQKSFRMSIAEGKAGQLYILRMKSSGGGFGSRSCVDTHDNFLSGDSAMHEDTSKSHCMVVRECKESRNYAVVLVNENLIRVGPGYMSGNEEWLEPLTTPKPINAVADKHTK